MVYRIGMPLSFAALVPYPIFIDGVQEPGQELPASIEKGYQALAKTVQAANPETVIFIIGQPLEPPNPYTPPLADPDAVNILGLDKVSFGDLVFDNDVELMEELQERAKPIGWSAKRAPQIKLSPSMHYAAEHSGVAAISPKVLALYLPYRTPTELLEFGQILGTLIKRTNKQIAVLAVGNLSTRADTEPGKNFDAKFKNAIEENSIMELIGTAPKEFEMAGEDAMRTFAVAAGAVLGASVTDEPRLTAFGTNDRKSYAIVTWHS